MPPLAYTDNLAPGSGRAQVRLPVAAGWTEQVEVHGAELVSATCEGEDVRIVVQGMGRFTIVPAPPAAARKGRDETEAEPPRATPSRTGRR